MVLNVNTNKEESSYDIIIEKGALNKASEYLDLNRKVLVVTDSGVPKEYSEAIKNVSKEAYIYCFPQGEKSKNINTFTNILKELVKYGFTRTDCIVAVGGGVVGDMSGYAASSYMRGIDFYNVPTTLLSQLDSSIGGKCAIDFEGVKNIVGAFYQPKKVLIDPLTLETLDDRLVSAGLVEGIKMAATSNKELFDFIKASKNLKDDIEYIITEALKIKRDVVSIDPNEKGLRKVLNFGHTIGHAIESIEDGNLYHGECVALGMMYFSSKEVKNEIKKILEKYNVNTEYNVSTDEIIELVKRDKKMSGSDINIVYVNEIGSFEFRRINVYDIKNYIEGRI